MADCLLTVTDGKNSPLLLIHVGAGYQLKYVVVQLIIEAGGFILAQLRKKYTNENIAIYHDIKNESS